MLRLVLRPVLLVLALLGAVLALPATAWAAATAQQAFSTELPAYAYNGTPSSAQYTVSNPGPGASAPVSVRLEVSSTADPGRPVAPDATLTATPSGATTCTAASRTVVTCSVPALAQGASSAIGLSVATTKGKGTVVLAATSGGSTLTTTSRLADAYRDVVVREVTPPPAAVLEGPLQVSYALDNQSTSTVHNLTVAPHVGGNGLDLVSCTGCGVGDLAAGATRTAVFTFRASLPRDPATGTLVGGRGIALRADFDSDSGAPSTPQRVIDVYRETLDSLVAVRAVDPPILVEPGDTVTLRQLVSSTGSAALVGIQAIASVTGLAGVTFSIDGVPCRAPDASPTSASTTCELARLEPGRSVVLAATGTAPAGQTLARLFGKVTADSYTGPQPTAGTFRETQGYGGYADISTSAYDLRTTAAATSTGVAGAPVTYSATVTNAGRQETRSTRVVAQAPPRTTVTATTGCTTGSGVVSCDLGPLAPGASRTVSYTVATPGAGTFATTFRAVGAVGSGFDSREKTPADDDATVSVLLGAATGGGAPVVTPPAVPLVVSFPPAPRTDVGRLLRSGLTLPTTCNQGCRVAVVLTVTGKDARRLALPRGTVVGRGAGRSTAAGTLPVEVRLTGTLRKKLPNLKGSTALTLLVTRTVQSASGVETSTVPLVVRP